MPSSGGVKLILVAAPVVAPANGAGLDEVVNPPGPVTDQVTVMVSADPSGSVTVPLTATTVPSFGDGGVVVALIVDVGAKLKVKLQPPAMLPTPSVGVSIVT